MDGGRFGLLPSRGITPSMEGRSAEREAVSERGLIHWTNAGAVFPPPSFPHAWKRSKLEPGVSTDLRKASLHKNNHY